MPFDPVFELHLGIEIPVDGLVVLDSDRNVGLGGLARGKRSDHPFSVEELKGFGRPVQVDIRAMKVIHLGRCSLVMGNGDDEKKVKTGNRTPWVY
jgi:hypothetical protein